MHSTDDVLPASSVPLARSLDDCPVFTLLSWHLPHFYFTPTVIPTLTSTFQQQACALSKLVPASYLFYLGMHSTAPLCMLLSKAVEHY